MGTNEFDEESTQNYRDYQKEISQLSIVDIIEAYDYIYTLSQFIPKNNEVFDNFDEIVKPLLTVIQKLETKKVCPHCGIDLFKSDLPQYDYVCFLCEENFYECEV